MAQGLTLQQLTQMGAKPTGGMTLDQLKAAQPDPLNGFAAIDSANKPPSILSNIKSDFQNRVSNVEKIADTHVGKDLPTFLGGVLQAAGEAAGTLGDTAFDVVKGVIPQPLKNVVKQGVSAVADTQPVQNAAKAYASWKQQHPEAAARSPSDARLSPDPGA